MHTWVEGGSCVDELCRPGECVGVHCCHAPHPELWQTASWNFQELEPMETFLPRTRSSGTLCSRVWRLDHVMHILTSVVYAIYMVPFPVPCCEFFLMFCRFSSRFVCECSLLLVVTAPQGRNSLAVELFHSPYMSLRPSVRLSSHSIFRSHAMKKRLASFLRPSFNTFVISP